MTSLHHPPEPIRSARPADHPPGVPAQAQEASADPSAQAADLPPVAPVRLSEAGDPYAWMRNAEDPALLAYLAAERAWYERQTAHTAELREQLAAEMSARVAPASESAPWRQGGWWYFTREAPGQNYQQFCRSELPGGPARVLLDENSLLADPDCSGGYLALGVREVSPDGRLLAYSVDFEGDEVYQLRIRDLESGRDLTLGEDGGGQDGEGGGTRPGAPGAPERIERTYYGLAWAADSHSLFYTTTDAAYRPYQVWRHEIGADPARDALVYTEDDERFEVTVRTTRSGGYVLIETASRDTSETLVIPASAPASAPTVLAGRRKGVEYRAEHADGPGGGGFYLVTNENAEEFALVWGPVDGGGPRTVVIPAAGDTRLVACEVFAGYLVVTQRRGGAQQLRVVDRRTGEQRLIAAPGPEMSLELAENREYGAKAVLVRTSSLIDPPAWHEVDLASGEWRLVKRQEVPGWDPAGYRTERIAVPAQDGTPIPVTIAFPAGLARDGSAPCLLYGYGAYESCEWPEFSLSAASLLDRGFLYAVAHIRGGGEGGRRWWLQGRLDRKRTTFTDFVDVADGLAEAGWVDGARIVSRGLSAGGLLQGAVFSMRPGRWRGVVAEVPFVDVVTTMLDPTIPLTVTEWDEWGDPRDPRFRAYLASYAPYENVPSQPWPDLLVTGSLHDPRVLVHEPAKWVAKLRAAQAGGGSAGVPGEPGPEGRPGGVLFRPELGAGAHASPGGRYDTLAYEAEILAWILETCGRKTSL